MRPRLLLLFMLAVLALPLSGRGFDVRPAPSWVERLDVATDVAVAKQNVRWGIYELLSDHQVRGGSEYFRTVRKVLSPSGVQNASELELDFDPSFERLTIHEITLVRDGVEYDALEPESIRVIEKEEHSAKRIYDGERTALVFLRDVRPGDTIDYAWSVNGENPILGGHYADEYDLSSAVPSRRIRHRLLWPSSRTLYWRGPAPRVTAYGEQQILTWEANDVPALVVEDLIPRWYEPWRSVQVTDFASWSAVANWADALFRLDERSVTEVRALADEIRSAHRERDARITAAIRFVQDDIRYLGLEMGANSHQPHQPWETLDARWGDCKDKTLLLVALLRELGLEAYPALVNTRLQHRLFEKHPSPFLFDHVIAQVIDGGRVYWIDGTISDQGGTLTTIDTPSDRSTLIVRAGTIGLTNIEAASKASTRVEQTYTTTSFDRPSTLEVRTTFRGADADAIRSELARLSLEDFAQERINELASDQPKIVANGLPLVHDDRLRNVVTITERYRVPELWSDGHWTWYPRVLEAHLSRPATMIRKMPLHFPFPLNVEQVVRFEFPEKVAIEKNTAATDTPAFRYEYDVDSNGRTVTIRQSLRALRDVVAVHDVPEHLTRLNGIWSEIGYRLAPPGAQPASLKKMSVGDIRWAIGFFIVSMFVGLCWMLATRKPRPRAVARPAFQPGDAPASAVTVHGTRDIDAHLAARACACGATAYPPPDLQRARYADRILTIATRLCAACGREQSVYFTAA